MSALLSIDRLGKTFGGLQALSELTLDVPQGRIVGLIGPNGSGKTTTINVLTGIFAPSSGHVRLDGHDITGARPERIVRAGMARTFQNLRLYATHTVLDNVRAGQTPHCRSWATRFGAWPGSEERALLREARSLVERMGLGDRSDWPAGELSYGEKKRLEIARALATRPRMLLLDEPAAGMNPVELEWLIGAIRRIRDDGVTVLVVEHHMKLIMSVCDVIAVLNFGSKIAEGTPEAIARDPEVVRAYLGTAP